MNKVVIFLSLFFFTLIAKGQTADFTFQTPDGLFCTPSTVQFTQMATGSPIGFVWTFGNGSGSNSANPRISYTRAGTYTVQLIVIYERKTATVSKTIVINPAITAAIALDRNYICTPGDINFTASGTGTISNYEWNFGDGQGIVSTPDPPITHAYTGFGDYTVTLKATDINGCTASRTAAVSVKVPDITASLTPSSGCVPANVNFTSTVRVPTGSSVTDYTWDYGDGNTVSGTSRNSNHIYPDAGRYSPRLSITTSEGCTNNFSFPNIGFGTPPYDQIAYAKDTVICGSDAAVLVAKATDANAYSWNFGDGRTATVSDTITTHKYTTLGMKTVTVTPFYNGCRGVSVSFQVEVVGVIATYTYANTCADRKTYSFTNTSQGNQSSITWDFGDGSPLVHTANAIHTFPNTGQFVTRLTITDSITGCSDTYTRTIYTSDPVLQNADTSICRNSNTVFTLLNEYTNPAATYTWHVAGRKIGPATDPSLTVKAINFGNHSNMVVIDLGPQSCADTIRLDHLLQVKGPDLNFTSPDAVCLKDEYVVTNNSKPYFAGDSVLLWHWNFGADSTNDTTYQPQPYIYANATKFNVKLTAVDINGCMDTLVKPVTINPLPFLRVIPNLDTLCVGTPGDTLIAFHNDAILWSPAASLSCATCDTVIARPTVDTKYLITATTRFGCVSTDSAEIRAFSPFTASIRADAVICQNDSVQLIVSPPNKMIEWAPSTGLSNAGRYDPIAFPQQTTTYTATLTDSVGCFSSTADIRVLVKPLPGVEAGPDIVLPFNSPFTIDPQYSANVANYTWTPSDQLSCTTCPSPSGIALNSNLYTIEVNSDSGCVAKDSIRIIIECKDANLLMPTAFTPNGDNLNDVFYPLTRGIQTIRRFAVFDRYGKMVHEARNFPPNDKTYGWNGRIQSAEQSSMVYVYYLEAICDQGEKLEKKGSVILLR